ncbi:site-2 protease family protein [Methanimicrococcus blatticola]|uniref:PDZ domain-containing protein n=1 Tax=Methanimicrococcus blatticola TaxID=91560 RepID=A0A484F636_9EURY|nr:site-2 protease family protein [Methanimicrococcus blatticola]MBZ3934881.1 site-2 protease family protein [Methanimicrococcus blatticola]MCC2509020.1 site-2 protease family protein [Methanimicrococcus blatticola]TDQ70953.1 PDZ domain-containing protein [Methanimicrococcus blatticola]
MQTTTQLLILAFFVYWAIIYWLKKRGTLAKYNISATGPILMIETTKGLHLLDKIAAPRWFWRLFANIGIILMFAGMIFMFSLVVFSDLALFQQALDGVSMEPNEYTEIQNIFLIPGVNQFIPLVWGAIALIVAVFIHEMMHSVLARVEDIKVHSVGLIVALFPIGGFAKIDEKQLYGDELDVFDETDIESESEFDDLTATIEEIREHEKLEKKRLEEEQNAEEVFPVSSVSPNSAVSETFGDKVGNNKKEEPKAATKTQRSRILAAGVMSNFVVALIAGILFFGPVLGAMAPIGTLQITDADNLAVSSGLTKEMVVVSINGQNVTDIETVNQALANVTPGDAVTVRASYDRVIEEYEIVTNASAENINYAGILIQSVNADSPADSAGLKANSLIFKVDDEYLVSAADFSTIMETKAPGDTILLSVQNYDENGAVVETQEISVTLASNPNDESKAYIGIYYTPGPFQISLLGISVGEFNAGGYLEYMKTLPSLLYSFDFSEPKESVMTIFSVLLILMMMPFMSILGDGFGGFSDAMMQFFEPVGWAEPLGIGIFWIANLLYWVAWLNFYVGLFNCLPAIPLDGGHLFRTYFVKIAEKLKMNPERATRMSFRASTYLSGFIFLSFLLMFIWPYIGPYVLRLFNLN